MPPKARLHWVASAWILAASGCDYWRNLIEPKQEDKADLVLSVKDAWTGEALPSARCSVDGAEALGADAEGRISLRDAPTGGKAVVCSSASYHGRSMTVVARPGQGPVDITMARKGREHWYPEVPARHVRIEMDSGNLIFPGDLKVRGLPGNSTPGTFQYAWTSSHPRHGGLHSLPKVTVSTPVQAGDSVEFTLKLTVTATLADTTYEVGTDSLTFTLAKNQPPTLKIQAFTPPGTVQVGTGCQSTLVDLWLEAVDPDGDCRVRVWSDKVDSPIGLVDTTADCGEFLNFQFPIRTRNGPVDKAIFQYGKLHVKVEDGNEGADDTTLQVVTRSNMHPIIQIKQLDENPLNLTGQNQRFRVYAHDPDTMFLQEVHVDWKNGSKDSPRGSRLLDGKYIFEDTLTHIFTDAGTYSIEAKVRDACQVQTVTKLDIELVDNRLPKVEVKGIWFNPATHEYDIRVTASDEDVGSGMDALIVTVVWGHVVDKWTHQDFDPLRGTHIDTSLGIPFRNVEDATGYEIYVAAQDQFGGLAHDTLRLTPKQAFGLP